MVPERDSMAEWQARDRIAATAHSRMKFYLLLLLTISSLSFSFGQQGELSNLLDKALRLYEEGELESADTALRGLLPQLRVGKDPGQIADVLDALSTIASSLGRYSEAIELAAEAVSLRRESGDAPGEAASLNNQGLAHLYLGNYGRALSCYQQALELDREGGDVENEILRLNNIANVYFYEGNYGEALSIYLEALERLRSAGNSNWTEREHTRTVANLAVLYQRLGQNERALSLYRELLQPPVELSGSEQARLYSNLGVLYRHLGDPATALDNYQSARQLFAKYRHSAGELGVLRNIGILTADSLGDLKGAQVLFGEVVQLAEVTGNSRTAMQGRLYRGENALRLGDLAAAESDFMAALGEARLLGTVEEEWKALFGLGRVAQMRRRINEAISYYETAVTVIESLRSRLSGPSLRLGFLADKRDVYDALISIVLSNQGQRASERDHHSSEEKAAKAFLLIERARSRTFQDLLRDPLETVQGRRAPAQIAQMRELRAQIGSLWTRQLTAEGGERTGLRQEYNELEQKYMQAEEQLRQLAPLPSTSSPDLETVRLGLREQGIDFLIEFWLGKDYLGWVWVSPARAGSGIIDSPDLDTLESCVESLSDPSTADWKTPCRGLSDSLLGALEEVISLADYLAIVPDGMLELVPFEALDFQGAPLAAQSAVVYLPSASMLAPAERTSRAWIRPPWSLSLRAIGDPVPVSESGEKAFETWPPLPHSAEEIQSIAQILGGRKELFLGNRAVRSALGGDQDEPAPILHLATHAAVDQESPDRSRIVFSGSGRGTPYDYLFLREIPALDLSGTYLVTLSACETARGRMLAGEGVQDFRRVLLLAGAKATITSLWRISDEGASEFMKQFYYRLGRGLSVADALRETKTAFMASDSVLRHPYYWAPFVAAGLAGNPVPLPLVWSSLLMSGAAVLLALVALGGLIRRYGRHRP